MRYSAFLALLCACGEADRDSAAADDDSGPADCLAIWYFDDDGDGHGDAQVSVSSCDPVAGHVSVGDDCDDAAATVFPGAGEVCDGIDQDCDGVADDDPVDGPRWYADADGDGVGAGDPRVACAAPDGHVESGDDCNDADDRVSPVALEVCGNGEDDDCDGDEDEGDDAEGTRTFHADSDGDGYGDALAPLRACDAPEGYVADDLDCDDADALVNPDAAELCNGTDDDCDDNVDEDATDRATWFADRDGDGHGDPSAPRLECDPPADFVAADDDCDDGDPATSPSAGERCGGGDENCDGAVDEASAADATIWFADADGDGYGDVTLPTVACDAPPAHVADDTDCDDGDASVSPGAAETCGGGDENCDGVVDEASAVDAPTWYTDSDGDGYGDPSTAIVACDAAADAVTDGTDCDDADAGASPSLAEVCNSGVDENCDGEVDEGCELAPGAYTSADAGLTILGQVDTAFGRDGILIADLDGDGVNTLIIATTYASASYPNDGAVYLFDAPGVGTLTYSDADTTFSASGANYRLGYPVLAGDQDGDGVEDLFASGWYSMSADCKGGAVMLSGATVGAQIADCSHDGRFGSSTDGRLVLGPLGAADLDDDGTEDLVGWLDDDLFVAYGPIDSWSRASAADVIITDAAVTLPSLLASGDYDGDGHDEVVFGASDRVWRCESVVSGTGPAGAGCVAAVSESSSDSWLLGTTVSGLGDADGDGVEDGLLVGAPGYRSSSATAADGMVLRFTGSLVSLDVSDADATWTGVSSGDALGTSRVFAAGDADDDGEPDVGFTQKQSAAYLDYDVAGHAGTAADADVVMSGPAAHYFGYDANAGDVDSDGRVDLVVSSVWDPSGGTTAGAVYVLYAD